MPPPDTLPDPLETENLSKGDTQASPKPPFFKGMKDSLNENGALVALFCVVFVNLVGFGIVVPLIPFFAQDLQAAAWQVTLMFSAYSLGQFFAEPIWGWLSDKIGRKPILIGTTLSNVVFYIFLANADTIWMAIFIRFISGLGSGNISTIQGYISDMSAPDQRASRMNLIGAAFSLGFIIGPVIGGALAYSGFQLPMYVAAAMAGIATFGVIIFVKESRAKSQVKQPNLLSAFDVARRDPVISRVILATLCYMGAFAGLESIFGLWAENRYGWGPKEISLIFLCIGLTAAFMQIFLTRRLVRLYGEAKVMAGGLAIFGCSFVLQGANSWPWLIAPIVIFGTLGQAVVFANISALISKATSPDRQGAVLGCNMAMGAIARIIGPVFAGFLFSRFGPDAPILMGAVLCLPAAWMALQIDKVVQNQPS